MYRNQKKYEQFNIIVMVNLTIVNNSTAVRANVIAIRTNSIEIGLLKAMMIENLKEKMKNGIAHFIFQKKNGELRECWGTTQAALAKAMCNGNGESREVFKTIAFFDVTKGEWRSFRWESLIQVF